jgi:Tol biopolymer transport system component
MFPDERNIAYFDGRSLVRASLRNYSTRRLYEIPAGFDRGGGLAISADSRRAAFVEVAGDRSRLRLTDLRRGRTDTVIEWDGILRQPLPRPKSASLLFRAPDDNLWLVDYNGRNQRRLPLAEGRAGPALFAGDGETLLYLNYPPDPKQLHTLREFALDTGEDTLIAKTSSSSPLRLTETPRSSSAPAAGKPIRTSCCYCASPGGNSRSASTNLPTRRTSASRSPPTAAGFSSRATATASRRSTACW